MSADFWELNGDKISHAYRDRVDPELLPWVDAYLPEAGVVLDAFGGDGLFLESLAMADRKLGAREGVSYVLTDAHPVQCQKAKAREWIEVTDSVDMTDPIARMSILSRIKDPRLIIASGGLNFGVVSEEQANEILEDFFDCLSNGGTVILTGLTPSHITAQTAREIGFHVRNMSVLKNIIERKPPYQLYVLQK